MRNGSYINEYGDKYWYKDDYLHNENGPAIEYTNGYKSWFINGKLHRLDGPAIESPDGLHKYWCYEGQTIHSSSQEEFEHLIKLKVLW